MSVDLAQLQQRVIQAHEENDVLLLSMLYEEGGDFWLAKGKINEGCFCLTNAYVFALEQGLEETIQRIAQKLHQHNAL